MVQEKKLCSGCGQERYIQNKTKNLCLECVYKRSHEGKSEREVRYEKQKEKYNNRGGSDSRRRFSSEVKMNKSKTKATGEKEMFLEIWEERLHICTNPDCKVYLGDVPKAQFFSHIKPKSTHSELRLEKSNIRLLCFDCHFSVDHQGKRLRDEE